MPHIILWEGSDLEKDINYSEGSPNDDVWIVLSNETITTETMQSVDISWLIDKFVGKRHGTGLKITTKDIDRDPLQIILDGVEIPNIFVKTNRKDELMVTESLPNLECLTSINTHVSQTALNNIAESRRLRQLHIVYKSHLGRRKGERLADYITNIPTPRNKDQMEIWAFAVDSVHTVDNWYAPKLKVLELTGACLNQLPTMARNIMDELKLIVLPENNLTTKEAFPLIHSLKNAESQIVCLSSNLLMEPPMWGLDPVLDNYGAEVQYLTDSAILGKYSRIPSETDLWKFLSPSRGTAHLMFSNDYSTSNICISGYNIILPLMEDSALKIIVLYGIHFITKNYPKLSGYKELLDEIVQGVSDENILYYFSETRTFTSSFTHT